MFKTDQNEHVSKVCFLKNCLNKLLLKIWICKRNRPGILLNIQFQNSINFLDFQEVHTSMFKKQQKIFPSLAGKFSFDTHNPRILISISTVETSNLRSYKKNYTFPYLFILVIPLLVSMYSCLPLYRSFLIYPCIHIFLFTLVSMYSYISLYPYIIVYPCIHVFLYILVYKYSFKPLYSYIIPLYSYIIVYPCIQVFLYILVSMYSCISLCPSILIYPCIQVFLYILVSIYYCISLYPCILVYPCIQGFL